jgi:hypothetical protein
VEFDLVAYESDLNAVMADYQQLLARLLDE